MDTVHVCTTLRCQYASFQLLKALELNVSFLPFFYTRTLKCCTFMPQIWSSFAANAINHQGKEEKKGKLCPWASMAKGDEKNMKRCNRHLSGISPKQKDRLPELVHLIEQCFYYGTADSQWLTDHLCGWERWANWDQMRFLQGQGNKYTSSPTNPVKI